MLMLAIQRFGARPAGAPVAEALDLAGTSPEVAAAVRLIGTVHGDGELPRLPVRMVADAPFSAAYARSEDGEPQAILVNSKSAGQRWAMTHEVGHFLDQQTLGIRGRYASHSSEDLEEWRAAVDTSEAVRRLQQILTQGGITVLDGGLERRIPVDARFLQTQISYPEIWARSYAQYVAVRASDPSLLGHLARLLGADDPAGAPPYTLQWDASDFEPILGAIDRLFAAKGWRT